MKNVIFVIIFLISFFLYLGSFEKGHQWGDDFALYISQTRALTNGSVEDFSIYSNWRQANSTEILGPNLYPWGYSVLLAPEYLLFGDNIESLKIYNFIFYYLALIVIFLIFKNNLQGSWLFLFITLFAFSPGFFKLKNSLVSDIPYMFFSLLTFYIYELSKLSKYRYKLLTSTVVGILLYISFSIRTQAIALIAAIFLNDLFLIYQRKSNIKYEKNNDICQSLLPLLLFIFIFLCERIIVASNDTNLYLDHFNVKITDYIRTIPSSIIYNILLPYDFFAFPHIKYPAMLIIFPTFLYGLFRTYKTTRLYFIYLSLNFLMLILYPYRQGMRFICATLPFYMFYFVVGLGLFVEKLNGSYRESAKKYIPRIMSVILCSSTLFLSFKVHYYNIEISGPYDKNNKKFMGYLKQNTSSDDVILFFKPRALYYLTGKKSLIITKLDKVLDSDGTLFIKHNSDYFNYDFDPDNNTNFSMIYSDNAAKIYKINKATHHISKLP